MNENKSLKDKLMIKMSRMMLSCEEVSQLTSEALDHKLTLRQKLGVRIHLMFCSFCRNFSIQMKSIRKIIKSQNSEVINTQKPPHKLPEDFKSRLRQIMKQSR